LLPLIWTAVLFRRSCFSSSPSKNKSGGKAPQSKSQRLSHHHRATQCTISSSLQGSFPQPRPIRPGFRVGFRIAACRAASLLFRVRRPYNVVPTQTEQDIIDIFLGIQPSSTRLGPISGIRLACPECHPHPTSTRRGLFFPPGFGTV
jgi:hypothetical protein